MARRNVQVLTGRKGRLPRSRYWVALAVLSLAHTTCYVIGGGLAVNEQWAWLIPMGLFWTIVAWLWAIAGVTRGRDMGDPSYGVALFTLVPFFGWITVCYLGVIADEAREYNAE